MVAGINCSLADYLALKVKNKHVIPENKGWFMK